MAVGFTSAHKKIIPTSGRAEWETGDESAYDSLRLPVKLRVKKSRNVTFSTNADREILLAPNIFFASMLKPDSLPNVHTRNS